MINSLGTACISGCIFEGKIMSSNLTKCVSSCNTNEFSDESDTVNAVCKICSQNANLLNCIKCTYDAGATDNVRCTVCETGYFMSSDNSACVINCSLINEYTNTDKNKCVTDCHAEDITYYLSSDNIHCV